MNKKKVQTLAILSSGLEKRKDRGYEQSSYKLFKNIIKDNDFGCNVELYKGTGIEKDNEFVVRSFAQAKWVKWLGGRIFNDSYVFEYIIFATSFIGYSWLKNKRFDVIYTQEPRVSKTIFQLRFLLKGKPHLVFAMGVKMTPEHYVDICDRVQLVNVEHYQEAAIMFPNSNKFYLLENPGSESSVYTGTLTKNQLREKYNIKTSKVLISVGAINDQIKRMNHVVAEFASVSKEWTLILVGNPQNKQLIESANKQFGNRFLHFWVDYSQISELYAVSDVFTLASVVEGFGSVTIEAMSNGVPPIVHKRALNQWILESDEYLVDMLELGQLATKINQVDDCWLDRHRSFVKELYAKKFTWEYQKDKYQKLLLNWDL